MKNQKRWWLLIPVIFMIGWFLSGCEMQANIKSEPLINSQGTVTLSDTDFVPTYVIEEAPYDSNTIWFDSSFKNLYVNFPGIIVHIEREDIKVVYDNDSYFVRNDTITILKTGTFEWGKNGRFKMIELDEKEK